MAKYLDDAGLAYFWGKLKTALAGKVDAESGKGLSSNDYTSTEKSKLSAIESGAEVNTIDAITVNGSSVTVTAKTAEIVVPQEIFVATYGTTTAAQMSTALLAEKLIVAIRTTSSRLAVLYRGDPIMSQFWFSFIDIDGTVEEWFCDTDGWTRETTGLVPATRTINGNALSSNVTLDADDVGAAPAALVYDSKTALTSLTAAQTQLTTWFEAMPNQSERVFYITFSSSATGTISFAKGTGIIVHMQKGTAAGTATFYGRAGNPASTVKISTMSYVSNAWSDFQDMATTADIDAAIGGAISGSY